MASCTWPAGRVCIYMQTGQVDQAQLSLARLTRCSPRLTRCSRSWPSWPRPRPRLTRRSCPWSLVPGSRTWGHAAVQRPGRPEPRPGAGFGHAAVQGSPAPIPGWHGLCMAPGPRFSAPCRGFAGFSPISHCQLRPKTHLAKEAPFVYNAAC